MARPQSTLGASSLPDREREICIRFRQIRTIAGMKQEPFAQALEIPLARLQNFELGRSPIRYALGSKVCSEFGINQQWLATGEAPRMRPNFPLSGSCEECIPSRELFSTAFDAVLSDFFKDAWGIFVHGGFAETMYGPGLVPMGNAPLSIRKNWLDYTVKTIELAETRLPDNLFQDLALEIQLLIGTYLHENRSEATEWERNRGKRELETCEVFRKFVRDRLSNPATPRWKEYVQSLPVPYRHISEGGWLPFCANPTLAVHLDGPGLPNVLTKNTPRRNVAAYENHLPPMQKTAFSLRLDSAIDRSKLTQSQAAEKWGVSRRTLENWIQGRREPRGLYRERIEKILAEIEVKKEK